MMGWYGHGMGGWGIAAMLLSNVVFWGLIVAGVVVLVRYLGRSGTTIGAAPAGPSAGQVLADRFARSEIDEEEYRRRLKVLSGSD